MNVSISKPSYVNRYKICGILQRVSVLPVTEPGKL